MAWSLIAFTKGPRLKKHLLPPTTSALCQLCAKFLLGDGKVCKSHPKKFLFPSQFALKKPSAQINVAFTSNYTYPPQSCHWQSLRVIRICGLLHEWFPIPVYKLPLFRLQCKTKELVSAYPNACNYIVLAFVIIPLACKAGEWALYSVAAFLGLQR